MKKIRITSGAYAGRYVGARFGGGLVTNPDVQRNPPVNMPDAAYGLWAQEDGARRFFDEPAQTVQAELRRRGYESELVDVEDFIRPDPATQQ